MDGNPAQPGPAGGPVEPSPASSAAPAEEPPQESCGPLSVRRLRKDDGRALIVYERDRRHR